MGLVEGDAVVSEAEQAGARLLQGLACFPTSCSSLLTASSPTMTCGELNASAASQGAWVPSSHLSAGASVWAWWDSCFVLRQFFFQSLTPSW